jgi:hypothetical protein
MNRKPALLLATLLLLLAACARADNPPAATPAATGVPEATGTPAGRTPTPGSTPPPTATPRSATPEATATATPTPQPRADGLSFHFGREVGDFDRSLIIRAVEVTRELLRDESGIEPPAAVFAEDSAEKLAEAFREGALAQPWRSVSMEERLTRTVAEANYRGIVINTGGAGWQALDATERLRAVAHEFVHVIQLEHAGPEVADATLAGPSNAVPPLGPFWLIEGSAEVVSWLVLQELSLGNYADGLLSYGRIADPAASDLARAEDFIGFVQGGDSVLGISVLATDYLLRSRSLGGLFEFWKEIGRDVRWQTAFTRHFGLPPEFFYRAFADYYEAVWAGVSN